MFRLFGVMMVTWWIGIVESRVERLTPLASDATFRVNGKGFDKYEQVQQAFEELKKEEGFSDVMPQFKDLSDLWQAANIMTNVMHSHKKKGLPYGMFVDGIKTEADLKKFATPDKEGNFGTNIDPGKLIKDSLKTVPEGSKALFINLPKGVIAGSEKWSWIFLNKGDSISEKLGLKVYKDKPFPDIFLFREKDITPPSAVESAAGKVLGLFKGKKDKGGKNKRGRRKKYHSADLTKVKGQNAHQLDFDNDEIDYYYDNDDKYSKNQRALNRLINAYNAIDEN